MRKTGIIILSVLLIAGCTMTSFGEDGQKEKKKNKTGQDGQQKVTSNIPLLIDAKKHEITGNDEKAEELLRQYTGKYPEDPVAHFELARILANKKQIREAVEQAEKAVKLDPGNNWYKLFYAEVLQLDEKHKEAIAVYEEITKTHPENLDYLYQLAALYLMVEKYPEAIRIYDRIEAQVGISEEISVQKQKIYLALNQTEKARHELEALVEAYPDEIRYLSILAEFYMNSKMPEKGLETYRRILEADPGDPYVHMSMADYYRKTGNKQKAYEELKLGFANPNLDVDAKVNILLSFYDFSKLPEESKSMVMELAKTLIAVHPNDPKAHSIYGDLLVEDKKIEEGRNEFLKVIALDSSKFLVWQEMLRLDVLLEKYDHLAEYGKRAIELFPDQPVLYLLSGLGYYQQKNYQEALKAFRTGVKLVVNNNELEAEFYMYLGDTHHSLNDTAESDKAYEKSLQIKANNAYVLNNYAYYLSLRNQELEKAESMAKKAVTLDPENASFQDTYGWVLYKLERYNEAKTWVGKALDDKEGVSAEVMEHYGDILFKLGDPAQALEYWIKAKTKGPGSAVLDKKITEKKLYE